MTIFSIAAMSPRPDFGLRIQAAFPNQFYRVMDGSPAVWLVSAEGVTTRAVLDRLDMTAGGDGHALITSVGSYSGWYAPDLWEWIKTRTAG